MPKNPAPPTPGHNSSFDPEQMTRIKALTAEIRKLEADRKAVNESIGERRAAIKAMGVDMDAYAASKRRMEMDPDDRDVFDRSQALCNAALGVPVQKDLFDELGSPPAGVSTGGNLPAGLH